MQQIVIFSAIVAIAIAAPANLGYGTYIPLSKSTLTTSSQTVDHGSTHVLHTPVQAIHEVQYNVPLAKSTITQSNQVVNHGSTAVVHTPIVHAPVVHAPVVHAVHAPVYASYSAPVVAYKTPDSAITHHSSTVHETVPVVNSYPLYSLH